MKKLYSVLRCHSVLLQYKTMGIGIALVGLTLLGMPESVRAEEASKPSPWVSSIEDRQDPDFIAWRDELRSRVLKEGISATTFDLAFRDAGPLKRVLELDRGQPEFITDFWHYVGFSLSDARVDGGNRQLKSYGHHLMAVEESYGIPKEILVSFWGIESLYGNHTGKVPVFSALATLSFDERRRAFFTGELIHALHILQSGAISYDRLQGSWAGAMGQLQFLPSVFRGYAIDADGDNQIDIWESVPDVLHSAGHFLNKIGWEKGKGWGIPVVLPLRAPVRGKASTNPPVHRLLLPQQGETKSVAQWEKEGLVPWRGSGNTFPSYREIRAELALPAGQEGPAFLLFPNFKVILRWNRSLYFGLSVGLLSDLFAGLPIPALDPDASYQPLRREEVLEMQQHLVNLGISVDVDGTFGPQTRAAIIHFQRKQGLPSDGFADSELLGQLRAADRS